MSWRRWLGRTLLGTLSLGVMACGAAIVGQPSGELAAAGPIITGANGWKLRLLGEERLRWRLSFGGTMVGGLSGIDYDPATQTWVMLSDDRSERSPARFYTARMTVNEAGLAPVQLEGVSILQRPGGGAWPSRPDPAAVDPESIRIDPVSGNVLWTDEGQRAVTLFERRLGDERLADPTLREARRDGGFVAAYPPVPNLRMERTERGPRSNLTWEGLALTPDRTALWLSMEGPLYQDGPLADTEQGALLRFTRIAHPKAGDVTAAKGTTGAAGATGATGAPGTTTMLGQYAYRTEPVPHAPIVPRGFTEHGVSEILALSDTRILVLERSYVLGRGFTVRLFEADAAGATDIRNVAALAGQAIVPMKKRLVLDFAALGLPHLDNLEGMSWGPTLANGKRTLVFVSDDNFNFLQVTQLIALEVDIPPADEARSGTASAVATTPPRPALPSVIRPQPR